MSALYFFNLNLNVFCKGCTSRYVAISNSESFVLYNIYFCYLRNLEYDPI